ncbi:MAG: DUF721 domain-containing protein [Planctomycetaceae bacterium]|jgi:hypothetical protein
MTGEREPRRLGSVLSELFALRGYGRRETNDQLQAAWRTAAGETVARQTRAIEIKRGVLHVAVAHSPLLAELTGFFRRPLVAKLAELAPELRIKDVKFRLDGNLGRGSAPPATPT